MFCEKLFKDLNCEKIFNIYYISGEDRFLKQKYLEFVTKKIKKEKPRTEFFCLENKNIGRLVDLCEAVPLGCDFKCIVIQDMELDKCDKKELEILTELFLDIPDYCCVVIFNLNVVVSKTKIKKIFEIIKKNGQIADFKKPDILQMADFVVAQLQSLNLKISGQNAKKIVQYCGNDLNKIFQETSKLASYCQEKNSKEISGADIDLLIVPSLELRVFDIIKMINEKNQFGALKILKGLLENKEEPTAILAIISMNFLDLYRAKVMKKENKTLQDMTFVFDYKGKEFRLSRAISQTGRFGFEKLRKIINFLVEADFQLKTSASDKKDKQTVLEKTIIKIISEI